MAITVHPSAIIDKGAKIGDGSRIWHFVHVCGGAVIPLEGNDEYKCEKTGDTYKLVGDTLIKEE